LPWTDGPGPRPQRSEHDLFEVVQQRAAAIRRRRRAGLGGALGGLAAVVILAAGLARAGDDPSSALRVVGPPPSTTSTSIVVTTVLPPPPLPTTTVVAPAPTTTRAPGTSTTRAPATSTTRRPATSTTSTVPEPPPLPQCDPADVVVTAAPEHPTYSMPGIVTFRATAVNRSSRPCQQPLSFRLEFFDSAGRFLGAVNTAGTPALGDVAGVTWEPGEILTSNMGGPLDCSPQPCPPGTYTGVFAFERFLSPPATFTIT
jgi:hypothetical protein